MELYCPECGYDLRGIESDRCPECGWDFDRSNVARSQIPWTFRGREIPRWSAYWRTVWLGTWRIKRLSTEVVRPVEMRDARRFATVTALIAGTPFALTMLAIIISEGGTNFINPLREYSVGFQQQYIPPAADLTVPLAAGVTLPWVMPLVMIIFVWLVSKAAGPWFKAEPDVPLERQARAAALSYYASAPLVFMPVGLFVWLAFLFYIAAIQGDGPEPMGLMITSISVGWGMIFLCFVLFWVNALRLLRRTLNAPATRIAWAAMMLLVSWASCAAIAFLLLPWVTGFLWLMLDSLMS